LEDVRRLSDLLLQNTADGKHKREKSAFRRTERAWKNQKPDSNFQHMKRRFLLLHST
jgi:hypothetical protein